MRRNARISRRRRGRLRPAVTAVSGFVIVALAVSALQHLVILIVAAVLIAGVTVLVRNRRAGTPVAGRRGQAPPPGQPSLRPPAAPGAAAGGRRGATMLDARGRRNGWLPPINPELVTVAISPQCAEGACAICPGNGCEHDCRHDPAIIVARNKAEYDRTQRPAAERPAPAEATP